MRGSIFSPLIFKRFLLRAEWFHLCPYNRPFQFFYPRMHCSYYTCVWLLINIIQVVTATVFSQDHGCNRLQRQLVPNYIQAKTRSRFCLVKLTFFCMIFGQIEKISLSGSSFYTYPAMFYFYLKIAIFSWETRCSKRIFHLTKQNWYYLG
jgi:hypothetical protein